MLAALALADYNVLDEWRKKMGGTVKSTVDPMTGHVSSLHRASSGTVPQAAVPEPVHRAIGLLHANA